MSDKSAIEWTEATWNPTTGCTKVSPGCAHCYIERTPPFRMAGRKFVKGHIPLQLHHDRLETPLDWRKPRRIFVNSLSDLFHRDVPDGFIDEVFAVMAVCQEHVFQVLTKRVDRLLEWSGRAFATRPTVRCIELWRDGGRIDSSHSDGYPWPLPNVWLGCSAEDQARADERVPLLLKTPAAVRFLSCEPLLGPIDFRKVPGLNKLPAVHVAEGRGPAGIDWVIAGGESGPGARPMHPDWARSLRDQCKAAGVPFFFKQWGEWLPNDHMERDARVVARDTGKAWVTFNDAASLGAYRVGKKAAGRLLDGKEYSEFPGRADA